MTASDGPPPRPPHAGEAPPYGRSAPPQARGAPPRPDLSVPVPSPLEAVGSPAPASVTRSFGLWVVSVVVCLAVAGYAYTKLEELRPGLREVILAQDPTITAESLDRVVLVSQFVAIGSLALFALLEMVFASLMRRGRNWARIMLATLGLISVPIFVIVRGLLSLDRALLTDYVLLGLGLYVLLMLAAVVTMFLPSANEWFRSVRGRCR